MATLTLRVNAGHTPGGWSIERLIDDRLDGAPMPISPADAGTLADFARQLDRHSGRSAAGLAARPVLPAAALDGVGRQLLECCCGDALADVQDRFRGTGHRLLIRSPLPEALGLPWELLPLGHAGGVVGCDAGWSLYRTALEVDTPHGAALPAGPLRILFLAAAPEDQKSLDYEKEEEAILKAVAGLPGTVLHIAEMGSVQELAELLPKVRPHVVHLSGHGQVGEDGVGVFCFEDEEGHADPVTARRLVQEVFRGVPVRCVFFSACQSSQATAAGLCQEMVRAGLPLAVGWAASVADDRATAFAETFYRQLLAGEPVPAALAHARLRIQSDGHYPKAHHGEDAQDATFVLPQLYCSAPIGLLLDPRLAPDDYRGPATKYDALPGRVAGLKEGFVGRRREQQKLIPALRKGDIVTAVLHGIGGQGKSTLATRVANRLAASGFAVVAVKSEKGKNETPEACGQRTVQDLLTEFAAFADERGDEPLGKLIRSPIETKDKLLALVNLLNKRQVLLVLDNVEDVLELSTRRIADPALAAFYGRLMTHLTSGARLLVTSRYFPAGTAQDAPLVRVCETLADFKEHEFLKFLRRDPKVEARLRPDDLSAEKVHALYRLVGGTPRFLGTVRDLLRHYDAVELQEELEGAPGKLASEREAYLVKIYGPRLLGLLSADAVAMLTRLALSELPLPLDAVMRITAMEEPAARQAIAACVDYGLLQEFIATDGPALYLPPGLWRPWLTAAERLPDSERQRTEGALAQFWRDVYERDRERELRVSVAAGLEACRRHARAAGNISLFRWATLRLAPVLHRIAEYREARRALEEIPEDARDMHCLHELGRCEEALSNWGEARVRFEQALAAPHDDSDEDKKEIASILHNLASIDVNEGNYPAARDKFQKSLAIEQHGNRAGEAATWHNLASIDLNEGNYPAARDKFQKALAIKQQIGDRAGEAATWHQLALIDANEGNYPAARDKFQKALAMRQQIGDRAGEAATWHGLATIDLRGRNYPAARDKFQQALAMRQQIGDRAGEAATWHQLAMIDLEEGNYPAARDKFQKSLAIKQQIGARAGEAATWHGLATIDGDEGNYPAARDKFQKSLAMRQQIGDRAGEAATWHQLGFLAAKMDNLAGGVKLVGLCFIIDQSIGHGDAAQVLRNFLGMCQELGYDEIQAKALLEETARSYEADGGKALLREAFGDG